MIALKGAEVSAKLKEQVAALKKGVKGETPCLAIVRVGENPDDMSYERGAMKKMEAFGLKAQSFAFPADITDGDFKREFARINGDPAVDGILLLRPLPKQICEADIERMIDPRKDLDGISPENIAKVFAGDGTGYAPCTAEAVMADKDIQAQYVRIKNNATQKNWFAIREFDVDSKVWFNSKVYTNVDATKNTEQICWMKALKSKLRMILL